MVCAAPGHRELTVIRGTCWGFTDCSEGWLARKISELPDLRFYGGVIGVDRCQLCSPTDLGSSLASPTHSVSFSAREKLIISRLL